MKLSEGTKRKLFVLSFVLWCVDAGLYLLSFFWTQMYRWGTLLFLPLFLGLFPLFLMVTLENTGNLQKMMKGLTRRENKWLAVLLAVSALVTAVNFIWNGMAVLGRGSGQVIDGVFWLTNHGSQIEQITEAEYLRLCGAETRLMLGHLLVFLAIPTASFGRRNTE